MIRPEVRLQIVETARDIAPAAAPIVLRSAREAIEERGAFRIALSGGATPRPLYSLLADSADLRPRFECWHVFFGDERMVPPDHRDSNYRMAEETLLRNVAIPPLQVHRVRTEAGSAAQAAALYEDEIARTFALARGQLPRFDLVLLGIGADGHTASLFPGSSAISAPPSRLVAATWVEKLAAERVTLTATVINAARAVLFLVSGADKAHALRRVLENEPAAGIATPPARAIAPADGDLYVVADRAAANPAEWH